VAESRAPGLRVQIVLALAGLMLLAFVPLFFAVASVTRATLLGSRVEAARALGRAVAAHVGTVRSLGDRPALQAALESHVGQGGVEALAVFDARGDAEARAATSDGELSSIDPPSPPYGEATTAARGASGRELQVQVPLEGGVVVARMRTDEDADRAAPLVRLVALYMATFALALLVFAYFSLTRLIVRPVDALVRAADRVATGPSATLEVPRAGARELADLGASVGAMTARLLANERALRAKVDELTRATGRLTEAKEQLARSERLASVGRLAAGIGHEIGNPIAALMGMEELLLAGDLPPEAQKDFLVRMRKETERIHGVLRDLLDFARPEQPPSTSALPTPASVGAVIDDVLALARPQKAFREVTVIKEMDGELRVGLAAPRLTQVLLNLVMNAGDAINAATKGSRVTVRALVDGGRARIEVEDDGPGIPKDLRERLFEPFVTTKEVGAGTGLGLAVCRGIVEASGGEIDLDTTYYEGARFRLFLRFIE
jgi:signal transduction histidine kinase